jgi:hypothetical protein
VKRDRGNLGGKSAVLEYKTRNEDRVGRDVKADIYSSASRFIQEITLLHGDDLGGSAEGNARDWRRIFPANSEGCLLNK